MKTRLMTALLLTAIWGSASATEYDNVTIEKLMLHRDFNNLVFIDLSISNPTRASCHTNGGWDYILDISDEFGRAIYSTLLAMKAAGSPGLFSGSGVCNLYNYAETLRRVQFK